MLVLNVSFGIFAFLPQGWLFMACVIVIECLAMTSALKIGWANSNIYTTTAVANVVSGLAGIVASMLANGGWWLVVWFPWVSSNEIDLTTPQAVKALVVFYGMALLLTLVIETLLNVLLLRKAHATNRIVRATLIANAISYTIGTVVLYAYSFR